MPTIRFESTRKGRTFCFVGSLLIGQARRQSRGDSWMIYFNPGAFTMRDYFLPVPDKDAAIAALKRAAETYL